MSFAYRFEMKTVNCNFIAVMLLLFVCSYTTSAQLTKGKHGKDDTQQALENKIINKVQQLHEVKERSAEIEHKSDGKRHLKYLVYKRPSKEFKYYWVKVMEDNGEAYVSDFNFYVNPKNLSVTYYDEDNDTIIDLKTWRKQYKK
jgi:hypothetical protein